MMVELKLQFIEVGRCCVNVLDGLESDGYTADADATLKQRFSQYANRAAYNALTKTPLVQETVVPLHSEPDPTPTTLMGLQVNPRRTFKSERSTPRTPRIAEPSFELALRYTLVRY